MRRKIVLFVAVALFSFVAVASVDADMLRGDAVLNSGATVWHEGTSQSVLVTPMLVDNLTTSQTLMAFCGDFTVSTTPAFGSSTGEAYGAHELYSPTLTIYNSLQKSMINDLFSYAYETAFDLTSGNVINTVNAQALQLAVWEVLLETGTNLSISSGSFYATGLQSGVGAVADSWLDVLNGTSTWASLGLTGTAYDLTVYVADGGVLASQTLISITGPPPTGPGPQPVVPEPATVLIFGIGAAAAFPFLRRKKTLPA